MAETAATSGFFRKNSQNKEGIDHHGRNYKLHLDFQKELKKIHCSRTKLQLQVDFSERVPKIKKALTTTGETTSYIQIFKKKKK